MPKKNNKKYPTTQDFLKEIEKAWHDGSGRRMWKIMARNASK